MGNQVHGVLCSYSRRIEGCVRRGHPRCASQACRSKQKRRMCSSLNKITPTHALESLVSRDHVLISLCPHQGHSWQGDLHLSGRLVNLSEKTDAYSASSALSTQIRGKSCCTMFY